MSLDLENHLVAKANLDFQPLTANFELTPECNLKCDMCFIRLTHGEVKAQGGIKDAAAWIDLARQLQDAGTLFILLTGGEPMLHPQFSEIYTALRDMGFIITLNTNGTMITEQMCRETFYQKPRRVNVTLYGTNGDTYGNLCHNREAYEQTMRSLRLLRKYDIDTKLNLSMTPANASEFSSLVAVADELGIPVVSNSYMFPSRYDKCPEKAYDPTTRLTPSEAARLNNLYNQHKLGEDYPRHARQAIMQATKGVASEEGYRLNCRAGRSSLWVDWRHHLTPCVMMETPCIDLTTGEANIGDGHTHVKPCSPGDIVEGWHWITRTCQELPPIEECKGCKLKKTCQVCYAAAILEKRHCGTINYLCDMAHAEVEEMKRTIKTQ